MKNGDTVLVRASAIVSLYDPTMLLLRFPEVPTPCGDVIPLDLVRALVRAADELRGLEVATRYRADVSRLAAARDALLAAAPWLAEEYDRG